MIGFNSRNPRSLSCCRSSVLTKTLAWPAPPTIIRGRDDIVLWKQVRHVSNIGQTLNQRTQQSLGSTKHDSVVYSKCSQRRTWSAARSKLSRRPTT